MYWNRVESKKLTFFAIHLFKIYNFMIKMARVILDDIKKEMLT